MYGVPPSPANFIRPGKIPMSSMCPAIIVNEEGEVELAIGAAGGTKITTSVAYIIMRQLFLGETLLDAMYAKRLHHQLVPMEVQVETGFDSRISGELMGKKHTINELAAGSGFAAVTGISFKGDAPEALYDPRRGGSTALKFISEKQTDQKRRSWA